MQILLTPRVRKGKYSSLHGIKREDRHIVTTMEVTTTMEG